MSRMTLVGLITNEGVECPALRTTEGQLYTLAYSGEPEIQMGDLVRVTGVPAQVSICMQGPTLQVESLQILYRPGGATLTSSGKTGIYPIPGLPVDFSRAALVSKVSDVKLYILKCHPPKLSISVQGFYSSTGWSFPHLKKRMYFVEPSDGIYDFFCLALPPIGEADYMYTPFSFTQTENMPMSLKGVRIYSQTKTPFKKMLDDSKAAVVPPDSSPPDFNDWQGKQFIRSGQANPGGDVVFEDTLINQGIRYRVLGPNDFGDMLFDAGRITIHLDEKDIVIAVSWG